MVPSVQREVGLTATAALVAIPVFALAALAVTPEANWLFIGLTVGGILLWLVIQVIVLALATHWASVAVSIVVPVVSIVLWGRFSIGALGGALLFLIPLLLARATLRRDIADRVVFRPSVVFGRGVRLVLIGVVMGVAGLALPILERVVAQERVHIRPETVAFVLKPLEPTIAQLVPGLSSQATLNQVIEQQLEQQTGQQLSDLTPGERAELTHQLSEHFGQTTPLTGNETLTHLVTNRLNSWIETVTRSSPLTVALVLIVLAVVTVRTFIPLITWAVVRLLAVVVWGMRRVGLLHLEETMTTMERLRI